MAWATTCPHYSVNASVPKTLITHLVRWVAESGRLGEEGAEVLLDVLGTDVSPELVPGGADDKPVQKSEDAIGPYELQDFNLYYTLRYGFAPTKVAFLALAGLARPRGRCVARMPAMWRATSTIWPPSSAT